MRKKYCSETEITVLDSLDHSRCSISMAIRGPLQFVSLFSDCVFSVCLFSITYFQIPEQAPRAGSCHLYENYLGTTPQFHNLLQCPLYITMALYYLHLLILRLTKWIWLMTLIHCTLAAWKSATADGNVGTCFIGALYYYFLFENMRRQKTIVFYPIVLYILTKK